MEIVKDKLSASGLKHHVQILQSGFKRSFNDFRGLVLPVGQLSTETAVAGSETGARVEISERAWLLACGTIFAFAFVTRFYALALKPMHHDEGVNGFFLTNLLRNHTYHYDPNNYHGPTLYYFALPLASLLGLSDFSVRLSTALFGLATIWLVLSLRRNIGSYAALMAAALVAVSPGSMFYARYFIHETLFVFFTLAIVVAVLRFYETGSTVYLILAAVSTALLFATKETAFVSIITLLLAWLIAWRWSKSPPDLSRFARTIFGFPVAAKPRHVREKRRAKRDRRETPVPPSFLARLGGRDRVILLAGYALALFIVVNVIFYSSFFTNWPGVGDAVSAMKVWAKTGTSEFHGKPFDTYLSWLLQEETPIFLLAIVGAFIALNRRTNRFALFVAAWAFGILVAYSLIPYKTPWLVLSFVVPMAIVAGYAVESLIDVSWRSWKAPLPALVIAGLALTFAGYQSLVLNFREYDNDRYPYVYTHSNRELLAMVHDIERIGTRVGTTQLGVNVASPEYWPLPWYFRDNPKVGYTNTLASAYDPKETQIVVARASTNPGEDQVGQLRQLLGTAYQQVGTYRLRPGVDLAVFARSDLVSGSAGGSPAGN
ncbi:MAG TPA: flippase activity-associated protein Agl23 [Pyrinomonadaceae bacterium]|nr:flippase activity-associated protein Agl23 [Pyrinomonadaceae bacterium]